jgi:hypothetical protein
VSSNRGSQQAEAMSFSEQYRGSRQYRQSLLMQLPAGSQALTPSSILAAESQQAESRLPVQWRAGYSQQSLLMKLPPQAHTSPTKRHKFSKSTFHSNFFLVTLNILGALTFQNFYTSSWAAEPCTPEFVGSPSSWDTEHWSPPSWGEREDSCQSLPTQIEVLPQPPPTAPFFLLKEEEDIIIIIIIPSLALTQQCALFSVSLATFVSDSCMSRPRHVLSVFFCFLQTNKRHHRHVPVTSCLRHDDLQGLGFS